MKLAKKILEDYAQMKKTKRLIREEDMDMGGEPEMKSEMAEKIEWLKSNDWNDSEEPELKEQALNIIMELFKSEDEMAKDFIDYLEDKIEDFGEEDEDEEEGEEEIEDEENDLDDDGENDSMEKYKKVD